MTLPFRFSHQMISCTITRQDRCSNTCLEYGCDCTYLYGQHAGLSDMNYHTWSGCKSRNLTKWVVLCASDGYVLYVNGPFYGRDSDDVIWAKCLADDTRLCDWLRDFDGVIGFDSDFPHAHDNAT